MSFERTIPAELLHRHPDMNAAAAVMSATVRRIQSEHLVTFGRYLLGQAEELQVEPDRLMAAALVPSVN